MCVAPDYVLVPTALKDTLIQELIIATKKFYGEDPENTDGYGKIINEKYKPYIIVPNFLVFF